MTTPPLDPLPLWPGTPPHQSPEDDFHPYLHWLPPLKGKARPAVLVLPGGGYSRRADHEGLPVAEVFREFGYQSGVLHYRVAPHRHPAPLHDVARALRLLRQRANAWRVDPYRIAVMGFSAGGHLAGSICTQGDDADLPDPTADEASGHGCIPSAGILAYPVVSSTRSPHVGSFNQLLGPQSTPEERARLSIEKRVSARTPPLFIWHTGEDPAVPVGNALALYEACVSQQVPAALHIFAEGRHGLGLATGEPDIKVWPELAHQFLQRIWK